MQLQEQNIIIGLPFPSFGVWPFGSPLGFHFVSFGLPLASPAPANVNSEKAAIGVIHFLASKFLGFKDSWCFFSWFRSFRVLLIFNDPYYQNIISCLLEDIHPIFKILKHLLDGSSSFLSARLFNCFEILDFQNVEIHK